jgi:hypothetical protein
MEKLVILILLLNLIKLKKIKGLYSIDQKLDINNIKISLKKENESINQNRNDNFIIKIVSLLCQ